MNKLFFICCIACLAIGFFFGRGNTEEKVIVKNVPGKTIRETITNIIADTVYQESEIRYKLVYVPDPIYRDVPVIDREESIAETIRDWNQTREYNKLLFDNDNGKLSVALSVQYNELQKLSYAFTPVHKETTIVKRRVFEPFVSATCIQLNTLSVGGGFFYYNLGFRAEWTANGFSLGVMYKF